MFHHPQHVSVGSDVFRSDGFYSYHNRNTESHSRLLLECIFLIYSFSSPHLHFKGLPTLRFIIKHNGHGIYSHPRGFPSEGAYVNLRYHRFHFSFSKNKFQNVTNQKIQHQGMPECLPHFKCCPIFKCFLIVGYSVY